MKKRKEKKTVEYPLKNVKMSDNKAY